MNHQCVILCGGEGTRLQSILSGKPKFLAPINNSVFAFYLLDMLQQKNINEVVLCTGHQASQITSAIGMQYKGISIMYSEEKIPLGTAGAIRLAMDKAREDPVLVINGDTYVDINIDELYTQYYQQNADGIIAITKNNNKEAGNVKILNNHQIIDFNEKPNKTDIYASSGVYLLSKKIIKTINEYRFVSLEKEIFPFWIKVYNVYGCIHKTNFTDIGTPKNLENFANNV